MRTLIHAAFLAGLLVPVAGAASAADLDHYYEPPGPPPVRVLPPRPFCGVYRPCVRPWRLGFYGPRWVRPLPPPAYGPRPYAYGPGPHPEGYGYDYDRERFERAHEHFTRYGYVRPGAEPREPYGEPRREFGPRDLGPRDLGPHDYGQRDRYERYGERDGRPDADPLGHQGRDGFEGRGRGYDRGYGPDERDDRGPYGRG